MSTTEQFFTFDLAQLGKMCNGRVSEQFALALADVYGQVQSSHVKRDAGGMAKGEITIKIVVASKEEAEDYPAQVQVTVTSKGPSLKPAGDMLHMIEGEIVRRHVETDNRQTTLGIVRQGKE